MSNPRRLQKIFFLIEIPDWKPQENYSEFCKKFDTFTSCVEKLIKVKAIKFPALQVTKQKEHLR